MIGVCVILFWAVCRVGMAAPSIWPWVLPRAASLTAKVLLFFCGVVHYKHLDWRSLRMQGEPNREASCLDRGQVAVVVSNHVSWLDILMVQVHCPLTFHIMPFFTVPC
jgi:1-acyl-sn-glycerol-3-phosphate acyltransferase